MAPVVIPAAIRTEILFDPLLLLPAKTKEYSEKAVQVRCRCLDCFEYVIYVLCHGFRSKKVGCRVGQIALCAVQHVY